MPKATWIRGWGGLDHEDFRYRDLQAKTGGAYWLVSHRARLDDQVITPPEHYVFLLRHRIAFRSHFHAASFNDEVLLPAHITLKNDHT